MGRGRVRMNRVIEEIIEERTRQQGREGWTPEHDDDELAMAAACYAASAAGANEVEGTWSTQDYTCLEEDVTHDLWPWPEEWDKRHKHSDRRKLVIAAALIVAEIERLDRFETGLEG